MSRSSSKEKTASEKAREEKPRASASLLIPLRPLIPIYAAVLALKNAAYDRRWVRPRKLNWPVISVGNISVGGAGKTPVVIRLAELLAARGIQVSILSRGYGRRSSAPRFSPIEVVDPQGSATRFGDEPLLIARRLAQSTTSELRDNHPPAQVVVGADRHAAGLLAESLAANTGPQTAADHIPSVHILDDGFQHRRLARGLDIVVLHRSDLDERLLPAGRLRETLHSLHRASILVLREEDADLERILRHRGIKAPIWWVRRFLSIPDQAVTQNYAAFCGIAHPKEFFKSLRETGLNLAAAQPFADHHKFSTEDIKALRQLAVRSEATAFITTEKDAVRLDPQLLAQLTAADHSGPAIPLKTAKLHLTFNNEEALTDQLIQTILSHKR